MTCHFIPLTPSGRGAVASFLLIGENAETISMQHWSGTTPLGARPHWGKIRLNEDGDEEVFVHRTAQDSIEIHSHGGELIASALQTLFQKHGVTPKRWQDHFTPKATQRELALRLLPFAPTQRTAGILLDQYNGAFEREWETIEQLPDKEEQEQRKKRLQDLSSLGKRLVEPFRVVLAGASNAGKSSLLNAVLGFNRSIVHSMPGTTRDVVSGQTALEGFPVMFFDTAGLRDTNDVLEQQGIDRTMSSLDGADLIVWVMDSTVEQSLRPPVPSGENVLLCYNKKDLLNDLLPTDFVHENDNAVCTVSALTGEGLESLLVRIFCSLVPHQPLPGEAVYLH